MATGFSRGVNFEAERVSAGLGGPNGSGKPRSEAAGGTLPIATGTSAGNTSGRLLLAVSSRNAQPRHDRTRDGARCRTTSRNNRAHSPRSFLFRAMMYSKNVWISGGEENAPRAGRLLRIPQRMLRDEPKPPRCRQLDALVDALAQYEEHSSSSARRVFHPCGGEDVLHINAGQSALSR